MWCARARVCDVCVCVCVTTARHAGTGRLVGTGVCFVRVCERVGTYGDIGGCCVRCGVRKDALGWPVDYGPWSGSSFASAGSGSK